MITVEDINEAWGWCGLNAVAVMGENAFGKLIIRDEDGAYWRISPQDLCCEPVAEDRAALDALSYNQEFLNDWYMPDEVHLAESILGPLSAGRKYCLRIPSALGGRYGRDNLAMAPLSELIRFSGEGAQQFEGIPLLN
ncbi:T6SS immunity protein Tdi1 domain-containing protein [Massilia sp. 9096]|uniref:T6SS immunity protein Tdi1 domain-containing protein n=1 Tax=Massilia sp. 9096 TaxID=1500894 RepID=UPI000568ADAA|nr:T6SS immunity protein Tdi1 domain-containing protein [Massilia sp. 9096]